MTGWFLLAASSMCALYDIARELRGIIRKALEHDRTVKR